MDWKNKHFQQELIFQAPHEAVVEAARRFAGESLPEWSIRATAEGFEASGMSALHHAVAQFRFTPVMNATKVDVELLVRRASAFGQYMLVDIGGYYDGLIRRWLWTIWQHVGALHTDPHGGAAVVPHGALAPNASPGARVVVMDAFGKAYFGVVRQVTPQGVLVAYDEGGERWVPAAAAHVVDATHVSVAR